MKYLLLTKRRQDPENRDNYDGWVLAEATESPERVEEWHRDGVDALNEDGIEAFMIVDPSVAVVKGVYA